MIDRIIAFLILCLVLGAPIGLLATLTSDVLLNFVFFYPLFMSGIWIAGGLYFWFIWERHWKWSPAQPGPWLKGSPLVSILIPCHDEEEHAEETILAALQQDYPHIEVIAINDGSTDGTADLLDRLTAYHPRLRVIHLARNQGKAMALRMGAMASRSDYLVCIDGDAMLEPNAVSYLVAPLIDHPRVGAVTGNPRIRTRSTLIGRIQVGEFSSIIGLTKRAQRVYGQIYSVSGVVTAFRREALERVGYWSLDMITEDIDITWKLQRDQWSVFFEPRALCGVLMPETLNGLWRQRRRWAQGGAEVLLKNLDCLGSWELRRMWPLIIEFVMSTIWAFGLALVALLWLIGLIMPMPDALHIPSLLLPSFTGMVLALMCMLQFGVSVLIDRKYEPDLSHSLYWIVWYPFVYWLISLFTTLVSFPKVMLRTRRRRARWTSPDRGIKKESS
ncbi:MAG TPA: poly-beta-1,6-N-acetyl-D-glucosamine synthase [Eoetvoesiella sp.]|jgi:biofilm PGA synthesis N-glycosyltransferase PgaC|uniref:poly-beta-1,6-N-acetyl-D-glucosamine synthase n=1 Tax=Eoetvoesiella sp. TaxID=1966355 RepID=UPI002CD23091|nr:poly-beta-1,6-N-acetyl-D-glucosamine synthase [Eoetvoesiella sp.]HWK62817.1 poly-beta-1,6-N-acetyl-D-glucosamine synthase [Eoetvoesiella sp.]